MLGGAGRMALPVYGDADGLDLQQEGDNDPAFLGVVLGELLAGAMRGMEGELGMNGKTFGFLIGFIHIS